MGPGTKSCWVELKATPEGLIPWLPRLRGTFPAAFPAPARSSTGTPLSQRAVEEFSSGMCKLAAPSGSFQKQVLKNSFFRVGTLKKPHFISRFYLGGRKKKNPIPSHILKKLMARPKEASKEVVKPRDENKAGGAGKR